MGDVIVYQVPSLNSDSEMVVAARDVVPAQHFTSFSPPTPTGQCPSLVLLEEVRLGATSKLTPLLLLQA